MTIRGDDLPDAKDVSALVLGAGSGQRLGGVHKAFLTIDGETLVERAVRLVQPFAAEILVALPEDIVKRGRERLAKTPARVVAGGATRQESVRHLAGAANHDFVLEVEVARPFATADHVAAVLAAARRHGAAIGAFRPPERDSAALAADDGSLERGLPRERVVWTRTPAAFRRDWLLEALAKAEREQRTETSTSILLRTAGFPVRLVDAAAANVKITLLEDLALLKSS
jgi:2-C-methyl-D-erythritol 4-phosphate cytidylyltransferase